MNKLPKITIITPTFNCVTTIEDTIKSVILQSYKNIEYLIIDGGSTDGTLEVIKSHQSVFPQIKYISEKDKGIYDAMNKGINLATGDYLYFLGGDDIFYNHEILLKTFSNRKNKEKDIIYGKVQHKHSGNVYGMPIDLRTMMTKQYNIPHQAIFYSQKVFKIVEKYDLQYPIYADYDFNIKCFSTRNIKKRYFNKVIAVFNEEGLSKNGFEIDNFYDIVKERSLQKYGHPNLLSTASQKVKQKFKMLKNFIIPF